MATTTKLRTVFKAGKFEVKRRIPVELAEKAPVTKKIIKGGQGVSVGVAGNTSYWGFPESGEHIRKLDGPAGRVIWDKMRRSDPQVQAVLQAITLSIRQARYYVQPGSEDKADTEIAEIIQERLLEGMSVTWDDVIRHALLMLPFGFSILEKIWEYSEDGLILPRKLDPRLPQSVVSWKYDKDKKRLIGPVQIDADSNEILLPIEKILIFTCGKEGDNWEGISLFRGAYKPWYIKDDLEKINAIKHDRHGVGVPIGTVPPGITKDSDEWSDMEDALEKIQANEQGYIVLPEGYEVDLLGSGSAKQGTDVIPSIKYYDEKIAISMLAMFMTLGTSQTGSRALGTSFTETFLMSLQTFADYIAEVMNRFLIREIVDYNWTIEKYPTLKVAKIKQLNPTILAMLAKAQMLTPDEETENAIRDELHLPEKKEDVEQEESKPVVKEKPKEDVEQKEDDEKLSTKLTDREFTDEELLADIPGIELRLNNEIEGLQAKIINLRNQQISDIIMQLVGGRSIQNIRIILKKDMHDELLREYKYQFKIGKKEVLQEVENQIGDAVKKYADLPATKEEFLELILEELAIKVEGAGDKLKSMLAAWAVDLKKKGLAGDALRQGLVEIAEERLSDQTWGNLAGASINNGWGNGRNVALLLFQDGVDYYYRSGILDNRICEVCLSKDRTKVVPGDPDFNTPDSECLGTADKCRCMTIAVMKSETQDVDVWYE